MTNISLLPSFFKQAHNNSLLHSKFRKTSKLNWSHGDLAEYILLLHRTSTCSAYEREVDVRQYRRSSLNFYLENTNWTNRFSVEWRNHLLSPPVKGDNSTPTPNLDKSIGLCRLNSSCRILWESAAFGHTFPDIFATDRQFGNILAGQHRRTHCRYRFTDQQGLIAVVILQYNLHLKQAICKLN